MRRLVMILLTMVLVCVGSSAHASIIYTVSVTGVSVGSQSETLTGTITTDGTIGQLTSSNFLAWSIGGSGDVGAFVADFLGGSVSCSSTDGCGVTASSTELDISGIGGVSFDSLTGLLFNVTFWQLGFSGGSLLGTPYALAVIIQPENGSSFFNLYGFSDSTIATVASSSTVPEPSTLALCALGIAALTVTRRWWSG